MEQQEIQFHKKLDPNEINFTRVPVIKYEWQVQIGNTTFRVSHIFRALEWAFNRIDEYITTLAPKNSWDEDITVLFRNHGLLADVPMLEVYSMNEKKMKEFYNTLYITYEREVIAQSAREKG